MIKLRSRLLTIVLTAAMIFGNLNLASLASGPEENGPGANVAPRGILTVNQTTVADFRAGSGINLTVFNESDGELRLRGFEVFDPGVPGISPIRDLEVDSKGKLYIGTQPGTVLVFDPQTSVITDLGRAVPDEDNINRLTVDKNDTLWGGGRSFNGITPNRGGILWRMNTTTMRFDAAGKVEMSNQQIRGLTTDKNGTVWAADMNGVLARFDPTTGAVTRLNGGNPLIPGYGIFRLTAAPNGIIYAGTTVGGTGGRMIKIDPTTNAFQVLNSNNPIVANDAIQALACAKNGTVYGGTAGNTGTIFMINSSNDQITILGRPIALAGSIGDLYGAKDGSVYMAAGGGGLADFHLIKIENGTGNTIDIGTPFPGINWPGMLAVAPDGTVYGSGNNQFIYKFSPQYSKTPTARLNRFSTGRIFTENFELSDINWDWTASGGPVNFIREVNASRPSGDQMVYTETADNSGASNAKAGSAGPNPPNADAFSGNPAAVYEITFKMNYGVGAFCGTRLYMDYYNLGQNYMLWFIEDIDTVVLLRDGIWLQTYNGTPLDHGFWYNVKWKVYHTGVGPGAAFCVWLNDTKIFDELSLPAPHRLSGSIILGSRVANASFDAVRLYKDTNITVNGLVAGQKVQFYAANGSLITSNTAGASVTLNVNLTRFPLAGYFNITDTGGVNVNYTSPVYPDVYGGDVYTLTSGPLGNWRYLQSGSYLSSPIDTGANVTWKNLSWNAVLPANTNISLRTRTAPDVASLNASAWSPFNYITPTPILSPANRFIQYEVNFSSTLVTATPELQDVSISYEVFPNFTLVMNQSADILYPGDMITYNIIYNQTGNGPSRDVIITDLLPPELVLVNSSDEGARNGSVWTLSNIGPRTDHVLTIQAKVLENTPDNTTILNKASVNFTDLDGTPFGNLISPTITATVVRPQVDFVMASPADCDPGETINYTIFLNNTGNGTTGDLWINVSFDPNVTFVTSSDESIRQGFSWKETGLVGHNILNLTARVNISATDMLSLSTAANFNYSLPNGYEPAGIATGPALTTVHRPIIDADISVDLASALPGDIINYRINYRNNGSGAAGDIAIRDTLDPQLELVNSSLPMNISDNSWHIAKFIPGNNGSMTITARVKDDTTEGKVVRNLAFVNFTSASGIQLGMLSTNEVTTTIGKLTAPNITVLLTTDRSAASWNQTVNLTAFFNNTGDGNASNAIITLELPAGMTLVSSSIEANRLGNLWNLSSVSTGEHNFTMVVKIEPGTANNTVLTATARLNYSDARGKSRAPSSSDISVKVTTEPVIPPPPPGTRPTIIDRTPAPNAIDVGSDTTIQVRFSAPMNPFTLTIGSTIFISSNVDATITWSGDVMVITPVKKLKPGTKYTVTITTDAKDTGGNQLDKTYTWDFTTKAKGTTVTPEGNNWLPLVLVAAVIIGVCAAIGLAFRRKKDKAPPAEDYKPSGEPLAGEALEPPKEEQKVEPEPTPEPPKEEPKPEPKPEPTTEQKPEPPKEETKPEPKPEHKPEPPKEEPKPEPKPEHKPEPPKEEPKSETAKDTAKIDTELEVLLKKLSQ